MTNFINYYPNCEHLKREKDNLELKLMRSLSWMDLDKKTGEHTPVFLQCIYCNDLMDRHTDEEIPLSSYQKYLLNNYVNADYTSSVGTNYECREQFKADFKLKDGKQI